MGVDNQSLADSPPSERIICCPVAFHHLSFSSSHHLLSFLLTPVPPRTSASPSGGCCYRLLYRMPPYFSCLPLMVLYLPSIVSCLTALSTSCTWTYDRYRVVQRLGRPSGYDTGQRKIRRETEGKEKRVGMEDVWTTDQKTECGFLSGPPDGKIS